MSSFKTVTIAGGTGLVGHNVAEAFLKDGSYKVKILRKKPENVNEKANLLASKGAEIVYVDYNQKDDLVKALTGTDVIVSTLSTHDPAFDFYSMQYPLLVASKEAGVKRFIPSEFGNGYLKKIHHVIDAKIRFREELVKSGLEYTIFFTGLFSEYIEFFGFDIANKTANLYVDGNKKMFYSCLSDVGKYVVESLKLPEARNGILRVHGPTLSYNDIIKLFEEATGSTWKVVVDKEVRHRFQNKIEPIPSSMDDFKVFVIETNEFDKLDVDKFSFKPRPLSETINEIVKAKK